MDLDRQFQSPNIINRDIDVRETRIRPENAYSQTSANSVYRWNISEGPALPGAAYLDCAFVFKESDGSTDLASYLTGTASTHCALRPDFFNSIFQTARWGNDSYSETVHLSDHHWVVSCIEDMLLKDADTQQSTKTYPLDYPNGLIKVVKEALTSNDQVITPNNTLVKAGAIAYLRLDIPTGIFFKNAASPVVIPKNTYLELTIASPTQMFIQSTESIADKTPVINSINRMELCIDYLKGIKAQQHYEANLFRTQFVSVPKFDTKRITVSASQSLSVFEHNINYLPHHVYMVFARADAATKSNRIFNFGNVEETYLTINNSEPIGRIDGVVSNADKTSIWNQLKKATRQNLDNTVIEKGDMLDSLNSVIDNYTFYAFPVNSYLEAQSGAANFDLRIHCRYNSTASIACNCFIIAAYNAVLRIDPTGRIERMV